MCETRACPVVHFASERCVDGGQLFTCDDVRMHVHFKLDADADSHPLCYCFGYTKEHVRQDIAENGETNIAEWITERVQTDECAVGGRTRAAAAALVKFEQSSMSSADEQVVTVCTWA